MVMRFQVHRSLETSRAYVSASPSKPKEDPGVEARCIACIGCKIGGVKPFKIVESLLTGVAHVSDLGKTLPRDRLLV
jgi:hypothetical protein